MRKPVRSPYPRAKLTPAWQIGSILHAPLWIILTGLSIWALMTFSQVLIVGIAMSIIALYGLQMIVVLLYFGPQVKRLEVPIPVWLGPAAVALLMLALDLMTKQDYKKSFEGIVPVHDPTKVTFQVVLCLILLLVVTFAPVWYLGPKLSDDWRRRELEGGA